MHDEMEQRIAAWKQPLVKRLGAETADELESHLRDLLLDARREGRSGEEAWSEAVKKIGTASQLHREFRKLRERVWLDAAVLMTVMLITTGLLIPLGARIGITLHHDGATHILMAHVLALTFAYIIALATGVIGFYASLRLTLGGVCNRLIASWTPRLVTGLAAAIALASGIGVALGGVWAEAQLGRSWGWDPREIGAGAVAIYHAVLFLISLRWRVHAALLLALANIGGALAFFAWFGPPALQGIVVGWPRHTGLFFAVALLSGLVLWLAVRRGSRGVIEAA